MTHEFTRPTVSPVTNGKPYIHRHEGAWCVAWYMGRVRNFVRCHSFRAACLRANAARHQQTGWL